MDSILVEKLFEEKLFENLWLDWLDSRNNFEHCFFWGAIFMESWANQSSVMVSCIFLKIWEST